MKESKQTKKESQLMKLHELGVLNNVASVCDLIAEMLRLSEIRYPISLRIIIAKKRFGCDVGERRCRVNLGEFQVVRHPTNRNLSEIRIPLYSPQGKYPSAICAIYTVSRVR